MYVFVRSHQLTSIILTLNEHCLAENLSYVRPIFTSYRSQSIDLPCKSIDLFLYDWNTGLNGGPGSNESCETFVKLSVQKFFHVYRYTELCQW